ncbi:hypothetical protein EBU71_15505 [bacterium]|nr:hypothetical protein [Candidatus Elulimicrobium humile]
MDLVLVKILLNGCFDLLHPGHIQLFEHCSRYPDRHVKVLIDSDRRIKEHKGESRPIINQDSRAYMIRSLKWVDNVIIFDTDVQLITLIASYQPDIMIKGSEYKDKMIIGESYCRQIVFIDIDEKYSTSKIISNIINRG